MSLSWKSNVSGTECRIFRGKLIVGLLKTSLWKSEGYGELHGHLLRFKHEGFFQGATKILDIEGKQELGMIRYNFWKGSARISYGEEHYDWQYESWTRTKWSVRNPDHDIQFKLTSFWKNEGNVEDESVSYAVILAALYVNIYLGRISAAS